MNTVIRVATAALLLSLPPAAGAAPALAQSVRSTGLEAQNKAVIRQAYARWAAGGTTFYDDVLTPHMTWSIVGTGFGAGTYHGRDTFKRDVIAPFMALLATPIKPVVNDIWADGDHVIVHWQGAATTRAGKPYRNDYAWIFHMRGGRADRVTAFLDLPAYQAVFLGG